MLRYTTRWNEHRSVDKSATRTHFSEVVDALEDVGLLDGLLDRVGVGEDGQMLLERLLHQPRWQVRLVRQLPQHLQHLPHNHFPLIPVDNSFSQFQTD